MHMLDDIEKDELQRVRLPRFVPRDRSDPRAYLTELDFLQRFRLSKEGVRDLLEEIRPRLARIRNNRGNLLRFA